jgi:cytochrome P450 / NADPH-cytochrome P450 reductase
LEGKQSQIRVITDEKPFGTGLRACIGRAFAWQEALLASALILQNFDASLDDSAYKVHIVQTLTIKPKDLYMRASLRTGITATHLQERLSASVAQNIKLDIDQPKQTSNLKPLTILYGSNTGTCQTFATKLAGQAGHYGYSATVQTLDDCVGTVPSNPVIVITASYEGQPPDNAARFIAWLEHLEDKTFFKGVK